MAKSGAARRRARIIARGNIPPQSLPNRVAPNTTGLRMQTARAFLSLLQGSGQVPNPVPDGILPAKFGDWVWIFQFEKGTPVGVVTIHLSEAISFAENFGNAAGGIDFAAVLRVAAKAETPDVVDDEPADEEGLLVGQAE